jgi:kynureninase
MGPSYEPADGVTRYLAGTPPILDLTAAEVGIRLVGEAGIDAIRAKSLSLTTLAIELHDAWLAPLGFSLGTPREPERRGGHLALRHPDAWRIRCALIERASVVPDFRLPDSIRFGFPPLYTSHADVWEAFARLRRLVEEGEHLAFSEALARVT